MKNNATVKSRSLKMLGAVAAIFFVASAIPLFADETTTQDGVEITVKDLKQKAGEYWKFEITAKNTTDKNKSFEGKIILTQPSPARVENPPPMVVATCTVFKKVKAEETITDTSYCKGGSYTSFKFEVVKVYDFISE